MALSFSFIKEAKVTVTPSNIPFGMLGFVFMFGEEVVYFSFI